MRYAYQQGSLDSFCSFYAVTNAIGSLLEEYEDIPSDDGKFPKLAQKIFDNLKRPELVKLCWQGFGWEEMRRLTVKYGKAIKKDSSLKSISLSFERKSITSLKQLQAILEEGRCRYVFGVDLLNGDGEHAVVAKCTPKGLCWIDSAKSEEYEYPSRITDFEFRRRRENVKHGLKPTFGIIRLA